MLRLPRTPRRSEIQAFWLSLSIGVALVVLCAVGALWTVEIALLSAFFAGAASAVAGRTRLAQRVYRAWDRLAAAYSRLARSWFLRLIYFVFLCVGIGRTRLPIQERSEGGWERRVSLPEQAFAGQSTLPKRGRTRGKRAGWMAPLAAWSVRSRNSWLIPLLPLLGMLRLVGRESTFSLSTRNYTLY